MKVPIATQASVHQRFGFGVMAPAFLFCGLCAIYGTSRFGMYQPVRGDNCGVRAQVERPPVENNC
jgi:hypothetical protein